MTSLNELLNRLVGKVSEQMEHKFGKPVIIKGPQGEIILDTIKIEEKEAEDGDRGSGEEEDE
jgi:hypothetical protein